jgi:three-Cys-motif partner protein
MPILSRRYSSSPQKPDILFVDGFAGPGRYERGEDGSPIIAIKTALEHSHAFPSPVSFLFIEQDDQRFEELVRTVNDLKPVIAKSPNIRLLPPYHGDCAMELRQRLDQCDRKRRAFGPALVFLDQFGYSAVTMDLIGRIMSNSSCEVFSYMNWSRLNPYMTDPTKWPAITKAVGGDEWKGCLELKSGARDKAFLKIYCDKLRSQGNSKFVWHFAMCGDGDQLLYWLFFCTNSIRGLEEMKKAMWEVDSAGEFRFSDGDNPDQLSFFKGANQEWLAEHLYKKFDGRRLSVKEIHEYVLVATPCYRFKEALGLLEKTQRCYVLPFKDRKKGSFSNEDMLVEFVKPQFVQGSLFG